MYDLRELYQEVVMDHNRRPRNHRKLADADRSAEGFNPLCGDRVSVYLNLDGETISDIGFIGDGCAISKATSSMMTERIKGVPIEEAERVFDAFRHMVTRGPEEDFDAEFLGDLEILAGVTDYPARIKCATLSWHTLHSALNQKDERVTTE